MQAAAQTGARRRVPGQHLAQHVNLALQRRGDLRVALREPLGKTRDGRLDLAHGFQIEILVGARLPWRSAHLVLPGPVEPTVQVYRVRGVRA